MKKLIALGAALVMIFSFAACGGAGGSGGMADGVYTAEADDAYVNSAGYGWRDTLTLTYKDGKLTDAVFESYDADGNKKGEPGNYDMDPSPTEWIPELSGNVLKAEKPADVDAIAGASIASGNAVKLYEAIVNNGKPGETIQVDLA